MILSSIIIYYYKNMKFLEIHCRLLTCSNTKTQLRKKKGNLFTFSTTHQTTYNRHRNNNLAKYPRDDEDVFCAMCVPMSTWYYIRESSDKTCGSTFYVQPTQIPFRIFFVHKTVCMGKIVRGKKEIEKQHNPRFCCLNVNVP